MKNTRTALFLCAVFLLTANSGAVAAGKCDGADIANGPFVYAALGVTQATFNGSGGSQQSTSFSITAPSVDPNHQTAMPDLFPGEGQQPCAAYAPATIGVLEIQKVGDVDGNPIDPVDVDSSSSLGQSISGAFLLKPSSNTFYPGELALNVAVTIANPGVDATDYGDYDIKLAAQAPGSGIGVGNGLHVLLCLRAPTATDTTPPVVNVTKRAGDEILGVIPVEIKVYDPNTLPVATGVASLSATVSSSGGTVSNLSIPLVLDLALPVAAGITVTGTGDFTPTGASSTASPAGTTAALAFTSLSRSGIGSYTIGAPATDGAGNSGYGSESFNVKYNVTFAKAFSTNPCKSGGNGSCTGQFQFTVNRSNTTSDGAFMYDQTVVVKLVQKSDNAVMATHVYGTGGAIHFQVQIDATTPIYQTNFRRGDLSGPSGTPSAPGTYRAEVYFHDVDNNEVLQGTSSDVTF